MPTLPVPRPQLTWQQPRPEWHFLPLLTCVIADPAGTPQHLAYSCHTFSFWRWSDYSGDYGGIRGRKRIAGFRFTAWHWPFPSLPASCKTESIYRKGVGLEQHTSEVSTTESPSRGAPGRLPSCKKLLLLGGGGRLQGAASVMRGSSAHNLPVGPISLREQPKPYP